MSILKDGYLDGKFDEYVIEQVLFDKAYDDELFYLANLKRKQHVGGEIHLKALLEISNICLMHCCYCGLRSKNNEIKRYRIGVNSIKELAQNAVKFGFKTVVLQSGQSDTYSVAELCDVITYIRELGASVTLSLGEKSKKEYSEYKKAGANRYLLRIETTDKALYGALHPKMSHKNRFRCLENLQDLGYETGCGLLIGLPNQSINSIAKDLLWLKQQRFDMAGIGPFIPSPNTPLQDAKGKEFRLSLKVMAFLRLLLPTINIPATTAMENLHTNGRFVALECGANVLMPNFTTKEARALYSLYPKTYIDDTNIKEQLASIGRSVSSSNGDSVFYKQRKKDG